MSTTLDLTVIGRDQSVTAMFDKIALSLDKLTGSVDKLNAKVVRIAVNVDDKAAVTKLGAVDEWIKKVDVSSAAAAKKGISALNTAFAAVVIGAGAAVVGSVVMAAKFETLTTRLATSAGESVGNLDLVGKGLLTLSGQVGYGATTLATGMYTVESAGFHAADALTVLKSAAQGAKAEGADLGTVANAVTTELLDYHLGADQAARVTSQLVAAVSLGKTNMQDFSGALHAITPIASSMGISLADVAGSLATMTSHGVSAEQGAQNLAETLRTLQKPSQQATAALAQIGLTVNDLQDSLKNKGLQGTLESISQAILTKMGPSGKVLLNAFNTSKQAASNLAEALKVAPPAVAKLGQALVDGTLSVLDYRKELKALPADQAVLATGYISLIQQSQGFTNSLKAGGPQALSYNQALQQATGNATTMNTALLLTGENAATASSNIATVGNATADASGNVKGFSEVQQTLSQKFDVLKASVGSVLIELGQKFIPIASAFVTKLMDIGHWIGDNSTWLTALGIALLTVVVPVLTVIRVITALAALQKGLKELNAAAEGLKLAFLTNPIVLVAVAIIALAAGFAYLWTHSAAFREFWEGIWNGIKFVVMAVVDWIVGAFRAVVGFFQKYGVYILLAIAPVIGIPLLIIKYWSNISAFFGVVFGGIWTAIKAVGAVFVWLWQTILQPVANVIIAIVTIIAKILIAVLVVPIILAIRGLGWVFTWLWTNAIQPAFNGIATAAQWLYNVIFKPVFDAIGVAVRFVYTTVLLPIWLGLQQDWRILSAVAQWLYSTILKPVFDAIGAAIGWTYHNVLVPIWDGLKRDWQVLADAARWFYQNVIKPIWDALGASIAWTYHNVLEPIWHAFSDAMGWLEGVFRGAVAVMGDIWDGLKKAFGTPIEFVIRTILNNGIIDGINWLLSKVGISPIPHIPDPNLPTFAAGGIVPGFDTGRDTVNAKLRPGEGILTPETVAAIGGPAAIHALNAMGKGRGTSGIGSDGLAHFGGGGFFGWIGDKISQGWDALQNVATGGMRLIAQGVFDDVIKPLENAIPGTGIAKQILISMTDQAERGILQFLGAKDTANIPSGGGGNGAASPGTTAAAAQAYASSQLARFGWGQDQMSPLLSLWNKESNWNYLIANKSSGAYGIPQSLPGSKMASAGADWQTNPATQVNWGLDYIKGRYGSPAGAWAHEISNNWYANGALFTKRANINVGEAGPELLLPLSRPRRVAQLLSQAGLTGNGGTATDVSLTFKGNVDGALATLIMKMVREGKIQIKQSQLVGA